MNALSKPLIERILVREVAGVFRSPEALDATTSALLRAGFDRADLDVMADIDEVAAKLRTADISATELADLPVTPRHPLTGPEDIVLVVSCVAGIAGFLGAAVSALLVVASGGSYVASTVAALVGGAVTGGIGALLAHRFIGRDRNAEMRAVVAAGGVVLWVRVRSPEQEEKALSILSQNGAIAVRMHEIAIEKRQEDLPLASIRPNPWLGEHRLGDVER
jgi:hypothetical protein